MTTGVSTVTQLMALSGSAIPGDDGRKLGTGSEQCWTMLLGSARSEFGAHLAPSPGVLDSGPVQVQLGKRCRAQLRLCFQCG